MQKTNANVNTNINTNTYTYKRPYVHEKSEPFVKQELHLNMESSTNDKDLVPFIKTNTG